MSTDVQIRDNCGNSTTNSIPGTGRRADAAARDGGRWVALYWSVGGDDVGRKLDVQSQTSEDARTSCNASYIKIGLDWRERSNPNSRVRQALSWCRGAL